MAKWTVYGYATASVVATVEADSEEEARKKALELDTPSETLDHQHGLGDGSWHFNGWDDPPEDAVHEVIRDADEAEKEQG